MADLRFDNRVAIVTGAGWGLGRSHALMLATRGACVVVNDIDPDAHNDGIDAGSAHEVVNEIRAAGGVAVATTDNVSVPDGAAATVAAAMSSFGRVDIVVNNASFATYGSFTDVGLADLMKEVSVHLVGSFNVSHAAWPHMIDQRYGRIVMTTSSAVLGRRDVISYSAAKAGQVGLAKSLALAGSEHGIKVNAIAPGGQTRMGIDQHVTTLPSGETRPISPDNASAAVTVLSHESCPATGEIFGVGAGHIDRLFIADTLGYTTTGVLVPEELLEHWGEVIDETGYYVPVDCTYHSDRLRNPHLLQANT